MPSPDSEYAAPVIFLSVALLLGGCVGTTTHQAPVSPVAVAEEEERQRELVLSELHGAQQRLDDHAFPLLRAAVPLCGDKISPRYGVTYGSIAEFSGDWIPAARTALGLGDTVQVRRVTDGSPAHGAGLRPGDRIVSMENQDVATGSSGSAQIERIFSNARLDSMTMVVRNAEGVREVTVIPEPVCSFGVRVIVEGDINAYADGENVIFPWAMMRFANDDELRVILAHEIAHNAMGHIDAMKSNALRAGLLGAFLDVALATQGVNTGGENTANFMGMGAMSFSQDFEREADYVGMYILARAGLPLESAPNLWRHFAQINPAAISYASSHPTTAERFVRLNMALDEINEKREKGAELLPEVKEPS